MGHPRIFDCEDQSAPSSGITGGSIVPAGFPAIVRLLGPIGYPFMPLVAADRTRRGNLQAGGCSGWMGLVRSPVKEEVQGERADRLQAFQNQIYPDGSARTYYIERNLGRMDKARCGRLQYSRKGAEDEG